MNTVELHNGDCLAVLMGMPENSIDAIVTDPPYGLSFMGKRWDYDVPSVEVWAECLRVLKPGGHLLAFAGTRTQHRMAVRIEDAGFEIRDMIAWVYGSGFPKSLDVSKAIDKAAGAEREVVGDKLDRPGYHLHGHDGGEAFGHGIATSTPETRLKAALITAPATEAARQWAGWGTALKPALEPITVARKPLAGTVAENVLRHGTGGLNIDGCRVPGEKPDTTRGAGGQNGRFGPIAAQGRIQDDGNGRWPANLIHDGSDEVLAAFPQTTSGKMKPTHTSAARAVYGQNAEGGYVTMETYGDAGSAARFFYCAKASKRDRDEGLDAMPTVTADPYGQHRGRRMEDNDARFDGKPAAQGKNHHPTVKPTDLMRYLCRLVTPPGGVVLDPFTGSGSTGKAAILEGFRFIGIEREAEYVEIARARIEAVMPKPEPPPVTEPQLGLFP